MKDKDIMSGLNAEPKRIFTLLLHNGALTKARLSAISGLKLTTLNRMMQPLLDLELIVESQIGESSGGRKPILYDVNPERYYVIGIDISRIYTQAVLTNLKMKPIEKYRFEMHRESTPEATLSLIQNWLDGIIEKFTDGKKGIIMGIGVGTVGPLDRARGIILNPENFEAKGWENISLKSILEEKTGLPAIIDNGANAAVFAETYYGIGKGIRNVVYLNCGIGIRTGVIASGSFVRTINDTEDAFAHMVIDVRGEKCKCGNYGCIERYSSIYSIMEEFISQMKKGMPSIIQKPVEEISYIDICKAAEINDAAAKQVINNAAVIMGNGLANFIKLLNPGIVVLSGPLIRQSKLFYEQCVETALEKSHLDNEKSVVFSRGGYFEGDAISIGSAALVVENYLNNYGEN